MGAHVARRAHATSIFILVLLSFMNVTFGSLDTYALLQFRQYLGSQMSLSNWNPSVSPCNGDRSNWIGVLCLDGNVYGLQLENMGLNGTLNIDALVSMPYFRTLSLMNNEIYGPFPEIKKLGKLKALYLSNNRFSGEVPDDAFEGMGSLKRVFLAYNLFTGKIPMSLASLPKLMELRLEGNQFQGQIPGFTGKGLKTANFASNELEGPIPASLSMMRPNSFSGNKNLCGPPLAPCSSLAPSPSPTRNTTTTTGVNKEHHSNLWKIILIIIIVLLVLTLIIVALIVLCKKRHEGEVISRDTLNNSNKIGPLHTEQNHVHHLHNHHDISGSAGGHVRRGDHGKLTFLRDDIDRFGLQDLLRASAEVLGSGTFGSSYKAVVVGQAMVVKRYKHMNNVGREEFHEHMRRIGRLQHPNLLPVAAYYYRKEEKLLVSEFNENGSLASQLHGNHAIEEEGLGWNTRLKIIKGVARGLAYLYAELPMILPHGHLKSSNVLLDEYFEPLLMDYALRPVINPDHAHAVMMAYKSPECAHQGRATKATDIWCFGILILEILSGKFPENYLTQGYDSNADLATWVNNMVKEKRTGDVFDRDMMGTKNSKGEMIEALKIGLSCCEVDAGRRPSIKEVVQKIEELKEGDGDEEFHGSESNAFSIRGNDEDFTYAVDR